MHFLSLYKRYNQMSYKAKPQIEKNVNNACSVQFCFHKEEKEAN